MAGTVHITKKRTYTGPPTTYDSNSLKFQTKPSAKEMQETAVWPSGQCLYVSLITQTLQAQTMNSKSGRQASAPFLISTCTASQQSHPSTEPDNHHECHLEKYVLFKCVTVATTTVNVMKIRNVSTETSEPPCRARWLQDLKLKGLNIFVTQKPKEALTIGRSPTPHQARSTLQGKTVSTSFATVYINLHRMCNTP